MELEDILSTSVRTWYLIGVELVLSVYMGRCLRAMRLMLRGAAWCCVVLCGVLR